MKAFLASSDHGLPGFPTFIQLIEQIPAIKPFGPFLKEWEDVIFSILIACIISLIFYFGTRKRELIPHGFQNFLESVVEGLQNLIKGVLGEKGDEHIPFLGSIFIYILLMNIFGIIPFMKSPSSSLSISVGMAIVVFARVQYLNIKNMGLKGFLYHLCGSPQSAVQWLLVPLMLPIEILTQLTRPVTLALRLTGNVMGEHALVGIFAMFAIAVFSFDFLPFGLPIQIPAMLFGLLTSLMQALVFTLLSTVYILLAAPHASEH